MRPSAPRHGGFTMIEVMTVLGIIGILAGLSAIALTRLKSRGNFASASGDFVATLRTARAEAFARGNNTAVIVDTQAGQWCAIEDSSGAFAAASWPPAAFSTWCPPPAGTRLIYLGRLPGNTAFGPAAGFGQALPAPYSGIPTGFTNIVLPDGGNGGVANITVDGGSAAPNLTYCSFCDPSTGFGAVTFLPSGGARFSGGPASVGQQISLQNVSAVGADGGPSGAALGVIDYAIVGATGAAEAVTIQ